MNKQRIAYWDVAKGITILTVILGHIGGSPILLRAFIFSFHMPLFFVANAYFIKEYDIVSTMKKSAHSLIIPYTITCILSAVFDTMRNNALDTNWKIFLTRLIDGVVGMSKISDHFKRFNSVWLVWFVICLFACRVLYVIVMRLTMRFHCGVSLIIVFLIAIIGYYVGKYYAFLPWSLDVSMFALPLMWIGDHLHKLEKGKGALFGNKIYKIVGFALAMIIWIVLVLKDCWIEMAVRRYPLGAVCLLCAICGIWVIVDISKVICIKQNVISDFFIWCGKNSMIILIIHCLELRFFDWNQHIYVHLPMVVSGIWYREGLVKIVCILFFSYVVNVIIQVVKREQTFSIESVVKDVRA